MTNHNPVVLTHGLLSLRGHDPRTPRSSAGRGPAVLSHRVCKYDRLFARERLPVITFHEKISRGGIIPALLHASSLSEACDALQTLDASAYPPFRLVLADTTNYVQWTDDGGERAVQYEPMDRPTMFTSSGLGDARVAAPRRELFNAWFGDDHQVWTSQQDRFHRHQWDDHLELSVNMSREDAMTVRAVRVFNLPFFSAKGIKGPRHQGIEGRKKTRPLLPLMPRGLDPLVPMPCLFDHVTGVVMEIVDANCSSRVVIEITAHDATLAYDPGPFEAGLFYYRMPNETRGHLYTITDKIFNTLIGDGQHTIEQLIYRHKRYRMQANVFLKRFADQRDHVMAQGESLPLVTLGNHCQGATFLDGSHLMTAELTRVIDEIAQTYEGFYFGRFDVRYRDVESFKAGRGFKIVELNGATSESTNIYDPKLSLFNAYRTLYRQWSLAFAIGSANRRNGAEVTSSLQLLRTARKHYKGRS